MTKRPAPPFIARRLRGRVSAGDTIGVAGRHVTVHSVRGGHGADSTATLEKGVQVWGVDDRDEAVLAVWNGKRWKDEL